MSNYFGQQAVQYFGHQVSLTGSLVLSFVPCIIFGLFMPETYGVRGKTNDVHAQEKNEQQTTTVSDGGYVEMTQ